MRFKNNGKYNDVYGKTHLGTHRFYGASAPQTEERFYTVNPACVLDRVGDFPQASTTTFKEAIFRAKTFLPQWGIIPAPNKNLIISEFQSLIAQCLENLTRTLSRENGAPLSHNRHLLQNLCAPISSGFSCPNTGVYLSTPTDRQIFSNLLKIINSGSLVWLPPQNMLCTASSLLDLWLQASGPPEVFHVIYSQNEKVASLLEKAPLQDIEISPDPEPPTPVLVLPEQFTQNGKVGPQFLSAYFGGVICIPLSELILFEHFLVHLIHRLRTGDPLLDERIHYGPLVSPQALNHYLEKHAKKQDHKLILPEVPGRINRLKKPHQFVGDPALGHFVWPTLWHMEEQTSVENWPKLEGPSFALLPYTNATQISQQLASFSHLDITFPEVFR